MKNYIITSKSATVLKSAFSRGVVETHEKGENRKSKFISYWLAAEYCRQPHHPPNVLLLLPPNLQEDSYYLLSIQEGISLSNIQYTYLKIFNPKYIKSDMYEVTVVIDSEHYTKSSQYMRVTPSSDCVWSIVKSTGGTGHTRKLHMFIFPVGKTNIEICSHYRSYRGAIDSYHIETIIEPGLYSYNDYRR